jgi:hypothetical protein
MISRRAFLGKAAVIPVAAHAASQATGPEAAASRPVAYELDRFFVAGFRYHEGPRLLPTLRVGDRIALAREPGNPHDRRAVALLRGDRRIGYVPRVRNPVIARLLDQGAPLAARLTAVDPEALPWEAVEVAVSIKALGTSG